MYDFYFGTKNEIKEDPKKYLLAVKRMLPRWCNSIPDSEYLALYDCVADLKLPAKPVFVETGSGASTLVLAYFALETAGELYTWDVNGSKLFFLRSVLNDTLMRHFSDKNINNHFKYVAFDSNSEFAGLGIIKELNKKISACFLDSEHTKEVLTKELENISGLLCDISLVAIDDGNYSYKTYNAAYINMIRKKHNLPPVKDDPCNTSKPLWQEVDDYLRGKFRKVEHLDDSYKKTYRRDLFWQYYQTDKEASSELSMEKAENLEHRFDAWKIYK